MNAAKMFKEQGRLLSLQSIDIIPGFDHVKFPSKFVVIVMGNIVQRKNVT